MYLTMGALILYNLACAIVLDVFEKLDLKRVSIYNFEVLSKMQEYVYDDRYFGLICSAPPLTILIFLISPLYLLIRNKGFLKRFNDTIVFISYIPYPLIVTPFFIFTNLIFSPIAYIFLIIRQCKKIKKKKKESKSYMKPLLKKILISPFTLIITSFTDTIPFW